ncbi:uncharacterized protein [Nicotiana tomentosiformis]|uniref:uncharacterized protein n=1 Tax=Nicotiana tomentosiformis TaxID=4098 RepID=UPI00388C55A3
MQSRYEQLALIDGKSMNVVFHGQLYQNRMERAFNKKVLREWSTKNAKILPNQHCIQDLIKRFTKIEFKHVRRVQNEFADALIALSSMIQHPNKNSIDPIPIEIHKQLAYYAYVEEEFDGNAWFHDIKEYLENEEYPENATHTKKRTLRRLANHSFQNREVLYRRTPDLGLLGCLNAKEAFRLLEEIHGRTCRRYMNGFVLAKKILRAWYFRITMETTCIKYS